MRRETITTEFDKDTDVIKKREVLDSLTIAINEGKKELEDIESQKKGKIKELATVVKRFDENDTLVKEHIESLKEKKEEIKGKLNTVVDQCNEAIRTRNELQAEIDGLGASLSSRKEDIDIEVAQYEKEAKKESKALAKSILEQTDILNTLNLNIEALKMENSNLVANINSNKEVVARATHILDTAESKEKELTELIATKTKEAISLGEDVAEKGDVLAGIERRITSKEGVLKGIERDIATREVELEALDKEKKSFERDKLVFSEQRQLILAKEQFVKDKYELAGLKYD